MNTRRHPRTLQEAFGPYTSSRIHTGEATLLPRLVSRTAIAVLIAAFVGNLILPTGCTSEQETAEAVEADRQEAIASRWIPEDAVRAAMAVPFATTKTKE